MFNKEKNSIIERVTASNATLISAGSSLNGDLTSDNDLRIDGTIHGNVSSTAKIIIGATGYVEGNIEGQQADINGKVEGNITASDLLQLRGSCNVQGNISAGKLQIEPTATFNGKCQMGTVANIVKMSMADVSAAEAQ
jgi:cytoskeletal protein CcmA (bactofilin family)